MVRDQEHALLLGDLAVDIESDAGDLAHLPMVPMRESAGVTRASGKKEKLNRHQRQREGEEDGKNQERTHASHDSAAKIVSYTVYDLPFLSGMPKSSSRWPMRRKPSSRATASCSRSICSLLNSM